LATSELIAGLIPGRAIAGQSRWVLRRLPLQPPGAKDVMTSLFGTNDKAALNVLVIAAVIVIAAGAGVVAARRFRVGAFLFVLFGVVAAFGPPPRQPLVAPVPAIATAAVATGAGLSAYTSCLVWPPGRCRQRLPLGRSKLSLPSPSGVRSGRARSGRDAAS